MPFYYYNGALYSSEELMHYGVPGMKWGVRRYLDRSGELTNRGRRRYNTKNYVRGLNRLDKDLARTRYKAARINVKLQKAERRGNQKNIKKYSDRKKAISNSIKTGENITKDILSRAAANNVKINSSHVTRYASHGARVSRSVNYGYRDSDITSTVYQRRLRKYGPEAVGLISGTKYKRAKK